MTGNEGTALLAIRDLTVRFQLPEGIVRAVRGVDLDVLPGETLGLVGESGAGKSVTARSVLGLLPRPPAAAVSGSVRFRGQELLGLEEDELRRIRGAQVGMIFQEPGRHLNPSLTIGTQIVETIRAHLDLSKQEARGRAESILATAGLGGGSGILRRYPHQLSGGQKQRAMIAMAVSCGPSLLIADEPVTALDPPVRLQILRLLDDLRRRFAMSVLFISHDLPVVRATADRVSVLYAGAIIETAPRDELFSRPLHPYTRMLLEAVPDPARRGKPLLTIPGQAPGGTDVPPGCPFHPRCPHAAPLCSSGIPDFREIRPGHRAACHFAEAIERDEGIRHG